MRVLKSSAGIAFVVLLSSPLGLAQEAYLKGSSTAPGDQFGWSVAISGDTAVVGAVQQDGGGLNAGAAHVFVRNGTTWSHQAQLTALNAEVGDRFGDSVAIFGNTIVVGAKAEDSAATGVNGNALDNSGLNAGAAYVFVRSGTTWSQQAYLKATNTGSNDEFGAAVAIFGDTIIVGAKEEDSAATGLNGNQADESATAAGAAYVYQRYGTSWTPVAYVKSSNAAAGDWFGQSLSISGDTAVVGSWLEDSAATGVNGNEADNSASSSGAAYVFVRNGTTWSQQAYLKASNTAIGDWFGQSAAIFGDTIVIGAQQEDSLAVGVNGNDASNNASNAGAAYVFTRSGTTWSQQAYLKASNTEADDQFGRSVAVFGDSIVVGAQLEDNPATGVNGNQTSNTAGGSGAAYVFVRNGTTWSQQSYLKASNTGAADNFGISVALFGDTVVVGAWLEDSGAIGVNGNQSDNTASGAGAAYVYHFANPWNDVRHGLPGTAGVPSLAGTGTLVPGSNVLVQLTGAAPNAFGLVFGSLSSAPVPVFGGTLIAFPYVSASPIMTDAGGISALVWGAWPPWFPAGTSIYFQYVIADAAAPQGASLSNALKATIP